ncbi:sulfurtransferase [Pedobacter sp. Hv1]|uniref:sulfurtransferase n=1 Tax=Pedobacter sp. Hv1 TaxID=1740090 RepID=UPI0006D8BA69|nr:sulfurtransferase [Pedobacter sp. Hv1]KQB99567.1 sulfurtransferase [Pedobacter sp. Hv1]
MEKLSPIIEPTALVELDPTTFVLVDASAGSKARYDENHLNGALYIDLNTDLAHIEDFAVGGRHPLPSLQQFTKVLKQFGIAKGTRVIIYDDKNGGNAAARFWWMLKAIGHEQVQVVNGGFNAAIVAGFPTSSSIEAPKTVEDYQLTEWALPLADINEVETASKTGNQVIVDVRDKNRFDGLTEPIDLIAGHIPGARNIPFTENLDENGFFLAPALLKEKYTAALKDIPSDQVIVHCGSGVTACHMLLAMDYAGLSIPKLYVGSWSEWSRNQKEMVLGV